MAHVLFSQPPYPGAQQEYPAGKIRLSIFLIAGVCGGLPAVVWSLRLLYRHYKSGGRISALVIMLLLSDLLELLLSPYVVTKLLQEDYCWRTSWTCRTLTSLWSSSMIVGLHLQQMMVLEGTLSLRHPHCSAQAFFPSCSIITSIAVFICIFFCELFGLTGVLVFSLPFVVLVIMISCVLSCRTPPHTDNIPYRIRNPSYTVLALVIFTIIMYISSFLWPYGDPWVVGASLMSLRVMMDPLLCLLIYRKVRASHHGA